MGLNDHIGNWRVGTFQKLTVAKQLIVGNQSIVANQGNSYFVDSGATGAADTRAGTSWATCLATIDGAINKCTANQGDVIYVAEGHTETYTTTGAKFTADIAGITIVGLGTGSDRPTISFGHTGTTTTISAANVTIVNLLFVTAVNAVVTYGTISGADCTLIDCESRDAANVEVVDGFTCTGDRLRVSGHIHNGDVASGDALKSVFKLSGVDDFIIEKSILKSKTSAATDGLIHLATECLKGVIDNCVFYVAGKTDFSDNVLDTATTSTVVVRNCYDLAARGRFSGGGDGTTFELAGDDVSKIIDALYGANGIAAFPTSAAPANDVSLAEVIRDIWDVLRNGTGGTEPGTNRSIINDIRDYGIGNIVTKDVTYDGSTSYSAFTVTGEIAVKVIGVVTTALTNHSDTTSVGTATSAAGLLAATAGTAMQTIDQIWTDSAPSKFEDFPATYSLLNEAIAVVGTANITGGVVKLYAFWRPISSDGNLVAAS